MKNFYKFLLFCFAILLFVNANAQAPIIVQQPMSDIRCVNSDFMFKVIVSGDAPINYQWYFEGSPIGVNSDVLILNSINLSNQGFYYCEVSNIHGTINSDSAQLVVVSSAPTINSQTGDQTICQSTTLTLTVDATADIASYMWYREGTPNYVHYGQTYITNQLVAEDSGNYYCVVSNICGSDTSEMIAVSIINQPYFVTVPENVIVCEGEDVTLSFVAAGDGLSYKWLADDVEIFGATEPNLLIENIGYPHNVFYKPVVSNMCAEIQGLAVAISVKSLPVVTADPISQSACGGTDITLYATAFSNIDITYQWYLNNAILSGEISSSISITTEEGVEDNYFCIITNECASVSTDTATIWGKESPIITTQPIDVTTCSGSDVVFSCKASGDEVLYYMWLYNGAIMPFNNTAGEFTNTLTINDLFVGQAGMYSCFVYNECGSTQTNTAQLIVNTPPVILAQADDITVCEGADVSIDIPIDGTEPIFYEWVFVEDNNIVSTAQTLEINDINVNQAGQYYLTIENTCGELNTNLININVNSYPNVISQPEDILTCEGESVSWEIEVEGTQPFTYLWYRNNSALSSNTDASVSFDPIYVGNSGTYFCKISNLCGEINSDPFSVLVGNQPSIEWHSGNKYLCENDTLILEVNPFGEILNFEWTLNNNVILNANDSVLFIPLINVDQAGEYVCRVFNNCGEVFTNAIQVNINPAPPVDLGQDIEACQGSTVTISPQGEYQSYSWNNGESTAPWFDVTESGTYFVRVVGTNGCANYDTVLVTIHPIVSVNLGDDFSNCGSTSISGPEGAYSYLWSTGSTSQTINVSQTGTYWLRTTGSAFGCVSSDTINISIYEQPSIDLGADRVITQDSSINIGVDAIYHSYMWNNGFNGPVQTFNGNSLGVGSHRIWLRVATVNNCMATDTVYITVLPIQAIGDINNISFEIYPNPAKNFFYVKNDMPDAGVCRVNIIDLQGKQVHKSIQLYGGSSEWFFDCSEITPGLYIIEFNMDNGQRLINKISIQ